MSVVIEAAQKAKAASARLASITSDEKNHVLMQIADALESHAPEIFAANRRLFSVVLKALPTDAFSRVGVHNENGPETLEQQLKKYVKHLEHHMTFLLKKRALLGKPLSS